MAAVAWQPSGAARRWMTRWMCASYADGKLLVSLLPLRAGRIFPLARSCISLRPRRAGVGESTRGCRLEADKIREESRLSNPRWLFSSPHCFVASPRGFSGREEEGCGASRALDRWTTLSLHVLHRGTSYPSTMCKSKQYVEDVIIFALSSSILDSRAFF